MSSSGSWRRKKKEMSKEEALVILKQEMTPYWHRSDPLVAGLPDEEGNVKAFPIDHTFNSTPWLIYFMDSTRISSENMLIFAKEWHRKFNKYHLKTLVVYKQSFLFFKDRFIMRPMIEKVKLAFPCVIDMDGLLFKAFNVKTTPTFMIYKNNQILHLDEGMKDPNGLELKIHAFLRSEDPGLPLSPVFSPTESLHQETKIYYIKKDTVILHPETASQTIEPHQFYTTGKWTVDSRVLYSADNQARLTFKAISKNVSIFARSLSKMDEPGKFEVLIEDTPAFEIFSGSDLTYDETGLTFVAAKEPRLYHILVGLPDDKRTVTLRFPFAAKAPIGIYAICYSE